MGKTNEIHSRQKRTNYRQSKQRKKATKVRAKTDVIARTLFRTPVQVQRLSHAVNTPDIINARVEHDKNMKLKRRNPKTGRFNKIGREKLLSARTGKRKFSMKALRTAIARVEKEIDKVPLFEHFVRRAYDNDQILKALMAKILPDLKSVDAVVHQDTPFRLIIDLSDKPQEAVPQLGPGLAPHGTKARKRA